MKNNLEDFKQFKIAKNSIEDFKEIKIILEVALAGLEKHKKYKPVRWAISELKEKLDVVRNYVNKFDSILGDKKNG
jgi:hypothetical protein